MVIQRIGSKAVEGSQGFMSEDVKPNPGSFLERSKPETKIVQWFEESQKPYLRMDHGYADLVEGDRRYYSSWYA